VRKVHRRARVARAMRTLGNVHEKKDVRGWRGRGIRVSASDGDEPQREDDMPLGFPPVLFNYFLSLSLSSSSPSFDVILG